MLQLINQPSHAIIDYHQPTFCLSLLVYLPPNPGAPGNPRPCPGGPPCKPGGGWKPGGGTPGPPGANPGGGAPIGKLVVGGSPPGMPGAGPRPAPRIGPAKEPIGAAPIGGTPIPIVGNPLPAGLAVPNPPNPAPVGIPVGPAPSLADGSAGGGDSTERETMLPPRRMMRPSVRFSSDSIDAAAGALFTVSS